LPHYYYFFFSFIQSAGQISRTESYIYILWWVHLEVYYYIKNGEFSEMLLFFEMCCVSEIKIKKSMGPIVKGIYKFDLKFFGNQIILKLELNFFLLKLFVETLIFFETFCWNFYFYVISNLCLHSSLNTKILKSFHIIVTNCILHWFYRTTNSHKLCMTHFLYQLNSWPY
jgi:hypothetical protein